MRLIDADALIDNMRGCFIDNIEENIAVQIINSAPTIEPKRGKWLERNSGFTKWIRCSVCDHKFYQGTKTNFCPNCGADMRGKDDE